MDCVMKNKFICEHALTYHLTLQVPSFADQSESYTVVSTGLRVQSFQPYNLNFPTLQFKPLLFKKQRISPSGSLSLKIHTGFPNLGVTGV